MTTTLSEVADLFLTKVTDYRLDSIFESSGSSALNFYLEPYILNSIDEFEDICTQDLSYTESTDDEEGYFSVNLTRENKNVLAQLMVRYWLGKSIRDILQMNNSLQDHDYKTYSQAQNLKAKQDFYNMTREENSQLLVDYGIKHNNWTNWKLQDFD